MRIFVGNLSSGTSGNDLRQAFESFGQVTSVTIIMNGTTGKSREFGFVIMPSANEATNAIEKMNGKDLQGRKIAVEKSRTKRKPHPDKLWRSDSGNGGGRGKHHGRRHH